MVKIVKTGKALIEEVNEPQQKNSLWWMGQMGFAAVLGTKRLYLDLFLSRDPGRAYAPVCTPEEVTGVSLFFGSHDHSDHIDRPVWGALAQGNPAARFVVPRALWRGLSRELEIPPDRFLPVAQGETVSAGEDGLGGELTITGVAAAHEFLETDSQGNALHMGYVVRGGGKTLYHAGDTCLYEGIHQTLRGAGRLDVMILPINGRDAKRLSEGCIGNMTYQEAADLAGVLHPEWIIPGHYEMFPQNSQEVSAFCDYVRVKYPGQRFWVGGYGERMTF